MARESKLISVCDAGAGATLNLDALKLEFAMAKPHWMDMTIGKEIKIYPGPIPIDKLGINKYPERKTNPKDIQHAGGETRLWDRGRGPGVTMEQAEKNFQK